MSLLPTAALDAAAAIGIYVMVGGGCGAMAGHCSRSCLPVM